MAEKLNQMAVFTARTPCDYARKIRNGLGCSIVPNTASARSGDPKPWFRKSSLHSNSSLPLLLGPPRLELLSLELLRLQHLGLPLRVELLGVRLGLQLLGLELLHLVLLGLHRHLALVGLQLLDVVVSAAYLRTAGAHPPAVAAALAEGFAAEREQRDDGQQSR